MLWDTQRIEGKAKEPGSTKIGTQLPGISELFCFVQDTTVDIDKSSFSLETTHSEFKF